MNRVKRSKKQRTNKTSVSPQLFHSLAGVISFVCDCIRGTQVPHSVAKNGTTWGTNEIKKMEFFWNEMRHASATLVRLMK